MANNVMTIIDFSDSLNQKIESFIIASILEKRCNKLAIIDLNPFMNKFIFFNEKELVRKGDFITAKCFDATTINWMPAEEFNKQKLFKLTSNLSSTHDKVIIRGNLLHDKTNSDFIDISNEIVMFCDIRKNSSQAVINYFLKHNLKNKKIYLFAYNYVDNVQNEKTYLNLIKLFRGQNINIIKLSSIPNYKTLTEIENIDPWEEIYKKINGTL